jgi:hypothetical protein
MEIEMTKPTVEIANITLAAGKTEADLIAASDRFQKDFLAGQPGFLRRELVRLDDTHFADIVHWRSLEEAHAVGERIASSGACQLYFAVMAFDPEKPMDGVTHYASLATYAV